MNILLTGGTGFVGTHLTHLLQQQHHQIYIMTRTPEKHEDSETVKYVPTDVTSDMLPRIHAVINLAGASLFGYWTEEKKKAILDSRIDMTNQLLELLKDMEEKPEVLVNASAVGFYGTSDEMIFTERTNRPGTDFLAQVATEWEKTAKRAQQLGIRTVLARFGIVLGNGGALPLMELPVKLFVGGKIANGAQWLSWVHVDDLTHLILYAIEHTDISGPMNVVAPYPKRNKDFMKAIARVWHRPYWTAAPAPLVKLAAGEMSEMLVKGQYVKPRKALQHGYTFRHPTLAEALKNIKRKAQREKQST